MLDHMSSHSFMKGQGIHDDDKKQDNQTTILKALKIAQADNFKSLEEQVLRQSL